MSADAREARRRKALRALLERRAGGTKGARLAVPRRDRSAPRVLSLPQQRLWFLHQLDPSSPAYNLTTALDLRGPLDAPALAQALRTIVERHDTLRMSFPLVDG